MRERRAAANDQDSDPIAAFLQRWTLPFVILGSVAALMFYIWLGQLVALASR